jgi:hypothetical protein
MPTDAQSAHESPDEARPPKCIVCHRERTDDAYELSESELEKLVVVHKVWRARRVHEKYGAVPVCRTCFDKLGFEVEGTRPGDPTGLVTIRRRP